MFGAGTAAEGIPEEGDTGAADGVSVGVEAEFPVWAWAAGDSMIARIDAAPRMAPGREPKLLIGVSVLRIPAANAANRKPFPFRRFAACYGSDELRSGVHDCKTL